MSQDTEREDFEAWVLTQGLPGKLESVWAWEAWQARAALSHKEPKA